MSVDKMSVDKMTLFDNFSLLFALFPHNLRQVQCALFYGLEFHLYSVNDTICNQSNLLHFLSF